ncbi:winged helix-turn-helix transcriptional regulator [Haladaptatus sp. NG-SE-30]
MSDTSGTGSGASDWIENDKVREILQEHLGETDYAIYRELNTLGRISDTELGERVGLSWTAARRRRKKLIEEGIIDILAVMVLQRAELAYADIRLCFDTAATNEDVNKFIDQFIQEELIYEIDEYIL